MIQRLIAFALHQRFIILALTLLLIAGGVLAWTRLPIEAYPDVADVEVDVITLWPGHAAEEVERLTRRRDHVRAVYNSQFRGF